jgi:hypothetical protein
MDGGGRTPYLSYSEDHQKIYSRYLCISGLEKFTVRLQQKSKISIDINNILSPTYHKLWLKLCLHNYEMSTSTFLFLEKSCFFLETYPTMLVHYVWMSTSACLLLKSMTCKTPDSSNMHPRWCYLHASKSQNRREIIVPRVSFPSLEFNAPTPPPQASVSRPLWTQRGGEQHSLAGEGMGRTQFGRLDRKPALLVYSVLRTHLVI